MILLLWLCLQSAQYEQTCPLLSPGHPLRTLVFELLKYDSAARIRDILLNSNVSNQSDFAVIGNRQGLIRASKYLIYRFAPMYNYSSANVLIKNKRTHQPMFNLWTRVNHISRVG